uniref:Putative glycoprotein n=1 Tax=Soybean thrips chu-like virus 2 TaxID=2800864 RepID=A0A7T8G224_9VIRU|nr:putative glycoprotein [Soybean thrips chu-like virus 2]
MFFIMALALLLPKESLMFTAYDCARPTGQVTKLSLVDVGSCEHHNKRPFVDHEKIQLLQATEYGDIALYHCKVSVQRLVIGCGMHSHAYFAKAPLVTYIDDVSRDTCLGMHNQGTLLFQNKHLLTQLSVNASHTRTLTLAGGTKTDGGCAYGTYSDKFGDYEYSHVEATITIRLQESRGIIRYEDNHVILPTGTRCKMTDEHCFDEMSGHVFWTHPTPDPCHKGDYDVLYEGYSNKTYDRINDTSVEFNALYAVETNGVRFALMAKESINICGFKIIHTEHPRLFIVETGDTGVFKTSGRIVQKNLDPTLYANSKFVYLERHIKGEVTRLFETIRRSKCMLEQKMIRNTQALASISPDLFAYNLMEKPGYMAYDGGEAIYVIECTKMEAKIRDVELCYRELPVNVSGMSYFMTPRTHILKIRGTEIPCNRVTPISYKITDYWVDLLPKPVEKKNPIIIEPSHDLTWQYTDLRNFATEGVYTQEELKNMHEAYLFPLEGSSIANILMRGVDGQSINADSISMGYLMDEHAIKKAAKGALEYTWGRFLCFGQLMSGLLGLYMIGRIIKFIIDTVIHGITLHGLYGCSIYLIGAVWDSVTTLLIHLKNLQYQPQERAPHDEPPSAPLVPQAPTPSDRTEDISTVQNHDYTKWNLYPHIPDRDLV